DRALVEANLQGFKDAGEYRDLAQSTMDKRVQLGSPDPTEKLARASFLGTSRRLPKRHFYQRPSRAYRS
ncbi:MAG: hypothetical protein ACMG55_10220, partial [Microcoleus sp.]